MSGGGGAIADLKVQEQLLAEEEQAMAKYKEQAKATGNPFAAASSATGIYTDQIFIPGFVFETGVLAQRAVLHSIQKCNHLF